MPDFVEVKVGDRVQEIDMTVPNDTYDVGDVLADFQEIPNAFKYEGGAAILQTVQVLDNDDQAQPLYVVLARSAISLGTEGAGASISDADGQEIICVAEVGTDDYVDFGGFQLANPIVGPKLVNGADDSKSLWVGLLSNGTGTYSSGSMHIKIGLVQT